MRKIPLAAILLMLFLSCGKNKGTTEPEPAVILAPDKAALSGPASNATCTVGRVLSATQSAVTFNWSAAPNAENYDITIRNLLTATTVTQNTAATQLELTLLRNTPYAWYVTAKTSKTTTTSQSDTWKFYNAGLAATNYAPFPADLTAPLFNQNLTATAGKVTMMWTGSDVDNDISGYDIYLGTTLSNMVAVKSNQTIVGLDVMVTSGTLYYWKVVTKDSLGNNSTSVTNQFAVN
jgi:hypothetical protein